MWTYNYTFSYSYYPTICHHGIKGQKWGVRNGPPKNPKMSGDQRSVL